jgi:hypothetical protein
MRTKTLLLSALLGALGSVSVHAQNVYSLNAVGYINVTAPPGFSIAACPLIASPNNTISNLLNNSSGQFARVKVYSFSTSSGYSIDTGTGSGWLEGGTNTLNPGQAVFISNPNTTNIVITFVGTVPSGPMTNVLSPGFNLVSSIVPASGDLVTNSITSYTNANGHDKLFTYTPGTGYTTYTATGAATWLGGNDPTIANVGEGFFYENSTVTPINWVENYSVSQ